MKKIFKRVPVDPGGVESVSGYVVRASQKPPRQARPSGFTA